MPLPKPRGGKSPEKKSAFISRCAGDDVANKEFPDTKQRLAYCYSAWERKKETAAYIIQAGNDEILYTKSSVLLPEALIEKAKTLPESGPGYLNVRARYKSGKTYAGKVKNCKEFETDDDEIEDEESEMEDIEMND